MSFEIVDYEDFVINNLMNFLKLNINFYGKVIQSSFLEWGKHTSLLSLFDEEEVIDSVDKFDEWRTSYILLDNNKLLVIMRQLPFLSDEPSFYIFYLFSNADKFKIETKEECNGETAILIKDEKGNSLFNEIQYLVYPEILENKKLLKDVLKPVNVKQLQNNNQLILKNNIL